MNKLAVILIIAHKETLSREEIASLKQCYKILGKYPIRLIVPENLNVSVYKENIPDAQFHFIDPNWQSSYAMFNRLKIDRLLYAEYKAYEFILFYELDAWVFRDELEYWCKKNYDYIGAPWFEGWGNATKGSRTVGVGNGGFSLRKVRSQLKVLNSFSYIKPVSELWDEFKDKLRSRTQLLRDLTIRNNVFHLFNDYNLNEDKFWCMLVPQRFKWYKVAPVEDALKFAVETNPSYHIKNEELPFGCHAWQRYEPEFWAKYIHI